MGALLSILSRLSRVNRISSDRRKYNHRRMTFHKSFRFYLNLCELFYGQFFAPYSKKMQSSFDCDLKVKLVVHNEDFLRNINHVGTRGLKQAANFLSDMSSNWWREGVCRSMVDTFLW